MIVVANPGTHPELTRLAAALSRRDDLRYLTSASWSEGSALQRLARRPPFAGARAAATLRRRALPADLRPRHVVRVAGLHEAAFQVARGRGLAAGDSLMFARNRRFQRGAARLIERERPRLLVAQYTAARELFAVPGDHVRVLNHPIVHHRWMSEQERLEESENPEWAPSLRGSRIPDAVGREMAERMDAEIAAADLVLVPSGFVRSTFIDQGVDPDKLLVSALGADLPDLDAGGRGSADPDGPLQVLFAGQVTQRKGVSYLLEAVQRVPGVELVIMGHSMTGVAPLVRRYDRVRMVPSGTRDELYRRMQQADVLALPSLAEGFPLVAIEAMANGTAPILTDAAAAADLVEDGVSGWRVRARSTDDLVRVLSAAVEDRAGVAAAGVAARRRAERYTWAEYERRTADLVLDAVREREDRRGLR